MIYTTDRVAQDRHIFLPIWDKIEKVLDGKPAVMDLLYQYTTEDAENYAYRQKITSFDGWTDSITQRWLAIFNRAHINLELPPELEDIADNIDNQGSSIAETRADIFNLVQFYGVAWGLVDVTSADIEITTMQEQLDAGLQPYINLYSPAHIYDWQLDSKGQLTLVVSYTNRVIVIKKKEYKIFTKTTIGESKDVYYKVDKDGKERECIVPNTRRTIETRDGTPVMPWVVKGVRKSLKYPDYYKCLLAGIIDKEIELYNVNGQLLNTLAQIGFQFLAGTDKLDFDKLGQSCYLKIPLGETVPQYISPHVDAIETFYTRGTMLINQLYLLAGVRNRAAQSDSAASGLALTIEDRQAEDKVKMYANTVQNFEESYLRIMAQLLGANEEAIKSAYPKTFDSNSLTAELELLREVALTNNIAFYKHLFTELVTKQVRDPEDRKAIIDEIEASTGITITTEEPIDEA